MVTPREIIRDYLTMLNILRDNPQATFEGVLSANSPTVAPKETGVGDEGSTGAGISLADIDI